MAERIMDQRVMDAGLTLRQAQWVWQAAQISYIDSIDRAHALRDQAIGQAGERFNKTLDRAR